MPRNYDRGFSLAVTLPKHRRGAVSEAVPTAFAEALIRNLEEARI